MDDLIAGVDNVEQGSVYKKARNIMAVGGFNLRKWNSNSRELLDQIQGLNQEESANPAVNTSPPVAALDNTLIGLDKSCAESESSKLLGIMWNSPSDEFLFCFSELIEYAQGLPVTKRSVLR